MAKKSKAPEVAPMSSAPDDSYKHEQDARTLMDASEIMQDPKRMKHAHKHIQKKQAAMKSVKSMIADRNQKALAKKWGGDTDNDNEKMADTDKDGE